MKKQLPIFVAGHRGMVGSAIVRKLHSGGYENIIAKPRSELDLTDQSAVDAFFEKYRPQWVFLAAAKVGGIQANNIFPADFIYQNLQIQNNIMNAAKVFSVDRFLFLGSSCIYPKLAPQPIREESLLTGALEPTNRPYALAKIAGVEMCWSFNRQHNTNFLALMPTNLFGPGDNYHPENSHVIPALLRRFHEAKLSKVNQVTIWGTGTPRREFLYVEDLAEACVHIMNLETEIFEPLLGKGRNDGLAPIINVGTGKDITILELAEEIAKITGFNGEILFDKTKPDGTPKKLLDISRITSLQWLPRTPFQEGLKVTYQAFLKDENIKNKLHH